MNKLEKCPICNQGKLKDTDCQSCWRYYRTPEPSLKKQNYYAKKINVRKELLPDLCIICGQLNLIKYKPYCSEACKAKGNIKNLRQNIDKLRI